MQLGQDDAVQGHRQALWPSSRGLGPAPAQTPEGHGAAGGRHPAGARGRRGALLPGREAAERDRLHAEGLGPRRLPEDAEPGRVPQAVALVADAAGQHKDQRRGGPGPPRQAARRPRDRQCLLHVPAEPHGPRPPRAGPARHARQGQGPVQAALGQHRASVASVPAGVLRRKRRGGHPIGYHRDPGRGRQALGDRACARRRGGLRRPACGPAVSAER
mmetsp:Transcript_100204/g.283731  ORF Transcript_100204/g.283731 Transcript_100204/m.283731 type:complete len:217 (-) Transcript_100204:60-710(-)